MREFDATIFTCLSFDCKEKILLGGGLFDCSKNIFVSAGGVEEMRCQTINGLYFLLVETLLEFSDARFEA